MAAAVELGQRRAKVGTSWKTTEIMRTAIGKTRNQFIDGGSYPMPGRDTTPAKVSCGLSRNPPGDWRVDAISATESPRS
jgi:hypothetical protein